VFSRASVFLRQSLFLSEESGGAIFLNTATKSSGRSSSGRNVYRRESGPKRDPSRLAANTTQLSRTPSDEDGNRKDNTGTYAAALACNISDTSSSNPDQACHLDEESPARILLKTLLKFIKRVPGGQVYHFPELCYPRTGELTKTKSGNPYHQSSVEETDA
jgi:hypothetical protein